MKVYKRCYKYIYDYPEDMEAIIGYLKNHGEILVNKLQIESLYYEFSREVYNDGWMKVDDEILEKFEEWLSNYDR